MPYATSTPTSVPVLQGRKGIRENNSVQSPIDLDKSTKKYETRSATKRMERAYDSNSPSSSPRRSPRGPSKLRSEHERSGSYDSPESDLYTDNDGEGEVSDFDQSAPDEQQNHGNTGSSWLFPGLAVAFLIVVGGIVFGEINSEGRNTNSAKTKNFSDLEKEFSKQDGEFWRNIRVSLKEIPILDQPRTIIFLYNNKAENTLNKILNGVTEIALCELTKCSNKEVRIQGAALNTTEMVNDYGKIIAKYRGQLERNGVMIVQNLEQVPGKSAQAFHSFCDDFNPIVKHALIMFTLKVDNLPEKHTMGFVENFLLKLWSDIGKDDKFYPLFTRISSTILSVRPE